jgi:hypothetical protein
MSKQKQIQNIKKDFVTEKINISTEKKQNCDCK